MASDEEVKVKFEVGDTSDDLGDVPEVKTSENKKPTGQSEMEEEKTPMNLPQLVQEDRQPSPGSPKLKYGSNVHGLSPKRQLSQPRLNDAMPVQNQSESELSIVQVLTFCLFKF